MACKYIIKPKIGPNKGKEVESKLYNDLVNITGSEKAADEAYEQVHHPEFLRWFGDWINNKGAVSKVVDENGEPLIVYHGGEMVGDTFVKTEFGQDGFFFSNIEDVAEGYYQRKRDYPKLKEKGGKAILIPAFLNLKNPIRQEGKEYGNKIENAKTAFPNNDSLILSTGTFLVKDEQTFTFETKNQYEFIAFESNQIKHATENVGTYSLDPNIKQQKLNEELMLEDNHERIPETVMKGMLERLRERFGIEYKIIDDVYKRWKGKFQQGVAVVNLAYATLDTPFHEIAHPWVAAIKKENPALYNKLREAIIEEETILKDIQNRYPEMNYEDQIEESIVESIGKYAGKATTIAKGKAIPLYEVVQQLMRYLKKVWKKFMDKKYIIKPGDLSSNTPLRMLGYYMVYGEAKIMTSESEFMSTIRLDMEKEMAKMKVKDGIENINDITTKYQELEETSGTDQTKMNPGVDHIAILKTAQLHGGVVVSPDGKTYTWNEGTLDRLTNVVSKEFGNDPDKVNSESIAKSIFKNYRKNTETDKVTLNGVEYTYKGLVDYFNKNAETSSAYGSVVHKIMQIHLLKKMVDQGKVPESVLNKLRREQQELMRAKGNQEQIESYQIAWLDQIKPIYSKMLGITDADNIAPELMLHSPIMGMGTQIDVLVHKPNGTLHMIDYKSGARFYSSDAYAEYMPYASNTTNDIYNTKLNRAKLELTLRAIMIKEHSPSAKFSKIAVHHLDRTNLKQEPEPVNLSDFLPIIGEYFKKNNPDVYNKLKAKGLLDFRNYIAREENTTKDIFIKGKKMPIKERIAYYKNTMEMINNRLQKNESHNRRRDEKDLREIGEELLNEEQLSKGELDGDENLGMFKKWVGMLWNIKSKRIQTYTKMWGEHHHAYMDQKYEEHREFRPLVEAVRKEYFATNPIQQGLSIATARQINQINTRDLWSFYWVYRDEGVQNSPGYYAKTVAEAKQEFRDGKLTQAQHDIILYMHKRQNEEFSKVASKTAYIDRWGSKQSVAQMLDLMDRADVTKNGKLVDYFAPRLPASGAEILERYEGDGIGKYWKRAKDSFQHFKRKNLQFYYEKVFQEDYVTVGNLIPISYLGGTSIIVNENHSFDVEKMHLEFMYGLFKKNQMDPALAFAEGLKGWYAFKKTTRIGQGKVKHFKNLEQFMEKEIMLNILNRKLIDSDWASQDLTISNVFNLDEKTGEPKRLKISVYQAMMAMKDLRTGVALWLRFGQGTFNGAIILMYTLSSALKGSIAKRVGVDPNAIDFSMGDIRFGFREVSKYFGAQIAGTRHDNKLYNLMHRYNYLPDNYDYAIDKSDLRTLKNPAFRYGNLFFFHAIHEEWGHAILLAAQLHRLKHPDGSSLWDNYDNHGNWLEYKKDPKTGKQKYNVRFLKKEYGGKEVAVTELEVEEIQRMYAVSTLLHGGYRRHERTLMEANALGSWFLQFKKYLPSLLASAWQTQQDSQSLGWYQNWHDGNTEAYDGLVDEFGNRPEHLRTIEVTDSEGKKITVEVPVMEWTNAKHQGRMYVVLGMFARMISLGKVGDKYAWSELSERDKEGAIDFLTKTGALSTIMALSIAVAEGDPDESEYHAMKLSFLANDMMQGYNPLEIVRTAKLPFATVQMISDFSASFMEVMGQGVIRGRRTRSGMLPGQLELSKNVPFWSVQYELNRYGLIK
jgi:hypothetical protein